MLGGSISQKPIIRNAERLNRNIESIDTKLKELVSASNHNTKVLLQALLENREEIQRLRNDIATNQVQNK